MEYPSEGPQPTGCWGVEPFEGDLAVSRVLHFLELDIRYRADRLRVVDSQLLTRINSLVGQMEVDLNLPLSEYDE